jgi:histidinol-phosphate/aromatic aminotransferase/cobyric acid decarboxylase-like protein
MKRCWAGAGLLALLLMVGLLSACSLARFTEALSRDAGQAALSDRARAEEILRQTRQKWEQKRFRLTILSDHEPIREADTLFTLLETIEDEDSFRENALRLSRILRDLGQSQLPTWENIL